jgi:UDP-N-acetylmuramate dehydrogenase
MQIRENISLKEYNTFGIDVKAQKFAAFTSEAELVELLNLIPVSEIKLILGGGSNILLLNNIDGYVLRNQIDGIEVIKEDEEFIYVKSGAGENWHRFVLYCLQQNYGGVENLALIPGNVGASPMQNIGAYGVEIKDVFHELEAIHLYKKNKRKFSNEECMFGYRESVFKRELKGQYIITSVTFKLFKHPRFNTSYGAIQQELDRMGVKELSIQSIAQAVINIRSSKLPDPEVIGNAGSFFKNPVISNEQYENLKVQFPGIVAFPVNEQQTKLAAGWLIEHSAPEDAATWKGYREGDAGCFPKQALVLVNYGNAKGIDIYNLSEEIIKSVKNKFDVELEKEVNVITNK